MGLVLATPATAWGQAAGQKASAEALFEEGRRLMASDQPAEACPKFADSQRLDPSSGTLLNLGACYERLGRTASAWATYREAASLAQTSGRADHLRVAQKRAAALEGRLARVTLEVAQPAPAGLEVQRDGNPVTPSEWGLAIPVDAGTHVYEARAPGKKTWSTKVEILAEGTRTTVSVPMLKDAPAETAAGAPATPAEATPAADAPGRETSAQRTIAITVGVVGLVGLGVGTGFALAANGKYNDSLKECPRDRNLCTPAGVATRDDARTLGNVATVGFVAGGAALGAAAILWFTAGPSSTKKTGKLQLSPTLSGAMLRGEW